MGVRNRSSKGAKRVESEGTSSKSEAVNTSFSLVVAVVVVVATISWITINGAQSQPPQHVNGLEVPRWKLREKESTKPFAKRATDYGKPVVVQNSFVQHWTASSKWIPEYLKKKVKKFQGVYRNSHPYFGPYYDTTRPLSMWSTPTNVYDTNVTVSSTKFFQHIAAANNSKPKHFLYYSGEIERFGEWAINDITPFVDLISPMPQRSSINVWIGQKGVVAHCHYDGYHNFYVQLVGRKKFTLFPPTSWSAVEVFPFLHPSHAQCQMNISEVDINDIAGAQQVVLSPGDVLYLPPLTFHHVEAVDDSTSVNLWTDSTQSDLVQAMFDVPLPSVAGLQTSVNDLQSLKVWSTLYVLGEILSRVHHINTHVVAFVSRVVAVRFGKISPTGVFGDITADLPWDDALVCSKATQAIGHTMSSLAQAYATKVAYFANQLPSETSELWLGNYIEWVAATRVGPRFAAALLMKFQVCACNNGFPTCDEGTK